MVIDLRQSPDWRHYEEQVFTHLCAKYPDAKITRNEMLLGRNSKEQRQIDILIGYEKLGHKWRGIADCKFYRKNVDVKTVESFISMVRDVGVDFGIIFTETGYSKAAIQRVEFEGIKLAILKLDEIEDHEFFTDYCSECDPKSPLAKPISWNPVEDDSIVEIVLEDNVEPVTQIGFCDYCAQLYVRCACGTPVAMWDSDDPIECEGGCGIGYRLKTIYDRQGMESYRVTAVRVLGD